MPTYEIGSVILVNFPFTDLLSSKVRPALVLASHGEDVIILGYSPRSRKAFNHHGLKLISMKRIFDRQGLKRRQ